MSTSIEDRSLRKQTGGIRRLDAAHAREIVALFTRPVVGTDVNLTFDADDSITSATCGLVTLESCADDGDSAVVVGHYQTHLYLDGLKRLPLSVARQLVRHHGHLYLDSLTGVTDAVAATLATHRSGGLSLNNLRRLSPVAARVLGQHERELSLGVRRLALDRAVWLAHHANDLHLPKLAGLSPGAAAALSRHRGDLSLDGLERLSRRVATHLARHGGKLHLHGLTRLSDGAAEAFGQRAGYLCLRSVKQLSPRQARHLANHRGPLFLSSLEVDDDVAACLGRHEGALAIRVTDDIPIERLAALAQHRGTLDISGLERLDERRAAVLAAQPCYHGIKGLSGLYLSTVREVTPTVAAILATHEAGELALTEIRLVTEDVARALVKHPLLALDRVTSVTDRVAAILATHAGASLSLRSLEHVSPSGLAKLRENVGIVLPPRFRKPTAPGTAAAAAAPASTGLTKQEVIAAIERIAGVQLPGGAL